MLASSVCLCRRFLDFLHVFERSCRLGEGKSFHFHRRFKRQEETQRKTEVRRKMAANLVASDLFALQFPTFVVCLTSAREKNRTPKSSFVVRSSKIPSRFIQKTDENRRNYLSSSSKNESNRPSNLFLPLLMRTMKNRWQFPRLKNRKGLKKW